MPTEYLARLEPFDVVVESVAIPVEDKLLLLVILCQQDAPRRHGRLPTTLNILRADLELRLESNAGSSQDATSMAELRVGVLVLEENTN